MDIYTLGHNTNLFVYGIFVKVHVMYLGFKPVQQEGLFGQGRSGARHAHAPAHPVRLNHHIAQTRETSFFL